MEKVRETAKAAGGGGQLQPAVCGTPYPEMHPPVRSTLGTCRRQSLSSQEPQPRDFSF